MDYSAKPHPVEKNHIILKTPGVEHVLESSEACLLISKMMYACRKVMCFDNWTNDGTFTTGRKSMKNEILAGLSGETDTEQLRAIISSVEQL